MVTVQPSDRTDAVPGVMTKLTLGYSLTSSISSATCRVTDIVAYRLLDIPVQWLTDNGSAYTAHETRKFARDLNLEPCTTVVSSPEINEIAESFVKMIKRDCIGIMANPDSLAAVINPAVVFIHYNKRHPHSALGYQSPQEYIRRKLSQP